MEKMKYLLFETSIVVNTAVGPDIKKEFFILEVSDDVKITREKYNIILLCSKINFNQDLLNAPLLRYENIKDGYKIIVNGFWKLTDFINIFDTKEDAELYYKLEF